MASDKETDVSDYVTDSVNSLPKQNEQLMEYGVEATVREKIHEDQIAAARLQESR